MANEPRKSDLRENVCSHVTVERVLEAAQGDEYIGFCLECGAEVFGVEPDARRYTCLECGKSRVFGAEEILLMGVAHGA
jgi:DNA-directed RNA polymerase subunit RPC12/RpoP